MAKVLKRQIQLKVFKGDLCARQSVHQVGDYVTNRSWLSRSGGGQEERRRCEVSREHREIVLVRIRLPTTFACKNIIIIIVLPIETAYLQFNNIHWHTYTTQDSHRSSNWPFSFSSTLRASKSFLARPEL